MEIQDVVSTILLVVLTLIIVVMLLRRYVLLSERWASRKLIIYYMMIDGIIDAEFCMYMRLVYRRDSDMWLSLKVPTGCEERARSRLRTLQREFHGDEHKRVSGSLHVLMADLNVEKKCDVFNIREEVIRKVYYDFITQIKEEG